MDAVYCFCSSGVRMSPNFGAGEAGVGAAGDGDAEGAELGADDVAAVGDGTERAGFFAACGGLFTWYGAGSCAGVVAPEFGVPEAAAAGVGVADAGWLLAGGAGTGTATCRFWQADSHSRNSNRKTACKGGKRGMGSLN
jgi:hypothetical protein